MTADLSDTYHASEHYEQKLGLCKGYFRVLRTRRTLTPGFEDANNKNIFYPRIGQLITTLRTSDSQRPP